MSPNARGVDLYFYFNYVTVGGVVFGEKAVTNQTGLANKPAEEKDKCVMCGKETPYTKSTHIHLRYFYAEGCGQLCKVCWDKTDSVT